MRFPPSLHTKLDTINQTGKKERECLGRWREGMDEEEFAKLKVEQYHLSAQRRAAHDALTAAIQELALQRSTASRG